MENSARCFEWRKAEVARRGIDPSEKCADIIMVIATRFKRNR